MNLQVTIFNIIHIKSFSKKLGVFMKSLKFLLIVFLGIAVFGCSNSGINDPVQPEQSQGKQLLKLPARSNTTLGKESSDSKIIGVDKGGKILLSDSYTSSDGNLVTINAELIVPAKAFDDPSVKITITADKGFATFSFSPNMVFNKPLELNVTYTGLSSTELNEYANHQITFVYIDNYGNMTTIKNHGIQVEPSTGTLSVSGAKIDHFSRYGFAK